MEHPLLRRLRHFAWDRAQVGVVAFFHLMFGVTLLAAPAVQVLSPGTLPVFELAPRPVWAVLFLIAGLAAATLAAGETIFRQLATWLMVFPIGVAWISAQGIAVLHGRGSALGVVVWSTLLVSWAIAAVRIGLHSDLTRR